jgi:hypothetical protein
MNTFLLRSVLVAARYSSAQKREKSMIATPGRKMATARRLPCAAQFF